MLNKPATERIALTTNLEVVIVMALYSYDPIY